MFVSRSTHARLRRRVLPNPVRTLVELTLTKVEIPPGTTTIVKDRVALKLGRPSSETMTEIELVVSD